MPFFLSFSAFLRPLRLPRPLDIVTLPIHLHHIGTYARYKKANTTTFYSTTTVTVTVDPEEPAKFKRDLKVRAATEMPTAVPAYASGCDKPERYASACSCWGITATTSTAATPTKTVTVTVTSDYCEDL